MLYFFYISFDSVWLRLLLFLGVLSCMSRPFKCIKYFMYGNILFKLHLIIHKHSNICISMLGTVCIRLFFKINNIHTNNACTHTDTQTKITKENCWLIAAHLEWMRARINVSFIFFRLIYYLHAVRCFCYCFILFF